MEGFPADQTTGKALSILSAHYCKMEKTLWTKSPKEPSGMRVEGKVASRRMRLDRNSVV